MLETISCVLWLMIYCLYYKEIGNRSPHRLLLGAMCEQLRKLNTYQWMIMNILLTGASGFVGQKLVDHLLQHTDATLRLVARKTPMRDFDQRVEISSIVDIAVNTNWQDDLLDCNVVIHAAARVHVMNEHAQDPLGAYREINVTATMNLARQAASHGVKRFIYLSTIKVNGESTLAGQSFKSSDMALPQCAYSISKYEAEQGLLALAKESGMEVVILRPVLVYGPGVKGNFKTMMDWLNKGIPLPLGVVKNKRSFVSVRNLVDLITLCVTHPNAANQIFLVSDGQDLSTTELLKKMRKHFDKRIVLLSVPVWVLNGVAKLLDKQIFTERLCGSLQVDISKAHELLGWRPMTAVDDALSDTVAAYNDNKTKDL